MDFITLIESHFGFFLGLHISATLLTISVVIATDIYALLWLLGRRETLSKVWLYRAHRFVLAGLTVTATAGIMLFLPYNTYLLGELVFKIKILFVVFLFLNSFVIGKHIHIATTTTFASLSSREKMPLIISGGVSSIGWIGALIAAQLLPL